MEQTVKQYERLIRKIAFKMNNPDYTEDLIQVGRIAVFNKVGEFNGEGKIVNFLAMHIQFEMKRFLTEHARTIKIPAHQLNPTHNCHNPELPTNIPTVSTSTPLGNGSDDDFRTVEDLLEDEVEEDMVDDLSLLKSTKMKKIISELKPQYQQIITLRFTYDLGLQEIGEELGISKEAVRQQLEIIYKKIRKGLK